MFLWENGRRKVTFYIGVYNSCGSQNPKMIPIEPHPYIILSPGVWTEPMNMKKYHPSDYIVLHGKRSFADVIEVPNQLTLSKSKGRLPCVVLT